MTAISNVYKKETLRSRTVFYRILELSLFWAIVVFVRLNALPSKNLAPDTCVCVCVCENVVCVSRVLRFRQQHAGQTLS